MDLPNKQASWRVAVDGPMSLNFAIFVWQRSTSAEHVQFEAAWRDWWTSLLGERQMIGERQTSADRRIRHSAASGLEPPAFDALSSSLRAACQSNWPGFRSWWAPIDGIGRSQRLVQAKRADVGGIVQELEHEYGRLARPFQLAIDVIEGEQSSTRRYGDRYAIVAASIWHDDVAAARWLRETLAASV
jgi:hypothetical protein